MTKRFFLALAGIGLLVLLLALSGCVDRWSPEEGAAMTATAASHMVPTLTPKPAATATPTPQPQPSPTRSSTPTPVSDLPTGTQPAADNRPAEPAFDAPQQAEGVSVATSLAGRTPAV